MYRRPLADVQKAFSRLFQQNVHRYTHGLSELSGRCTDTTNNVDVTAPARQTESPCCLCPVSGHALRAVQPASESACSFLFLQPSAKPSVHSFCTPSVHLLYVFCTPSAHSVHVWTLHKPYCRESAGRRVAERMIKRGRPHPRVAGELTQSSASAHF